MHKGIYFVVLITILISCGHQTIQNDSEVYCNAEWDKATSVLMHTPGEELYYGIVHPWAGLFEYYFDVQAAADEHQHYKSLLRQLGIKVYEVSDILQELPLDTLRTLASQVLVYDVSNLSDSDALVNGETYRQQVLQEMTKPDLVKCLLHQPRVILRKTELNTGVEATYEDNSLMNLYFTRDQSITTPKGHIMCRMNSTQRAPETRLIVACYNYLGEHPILSISGDGRLEGGDYIPAGTVAYIGCGMRTNMEGIRQMMQADAFGHDTVIVVRDHRFWQMQMHLDTHFNLIDHDLCTMVASRFRAQEGDKEFLTADIYARAVGDTAYQIVAEDVNFRQLLEQRGMTIIPIEEADEMHYANNFLTIAPRCIMMVANQSSALQTALKENDVEVTWVPLENLIKGYGAAHCMTQVLHRQTE